MATINTILFASTNRGKALEVLDVAQHYGIEVVTPWEVPDAIQPPPDVDEKWSTYEENARTKAETYFTWSSMPSLADDAGLEVEALGGAPGVLSARYAGEGATSKLNIQKLLENLSGVKDRRARFVSYLHLTISKDESLVSFGELRGEIALAPSGGGGFGYDPIFIVEGTGKTLAELKGEGVKVQTHRIISCCNLFASFK